MRYSAQKYSPRKIKPLFHCTVSLKRDDNETLCLCTADNPQLR